MNTYSPVDIADAIVGVLEASNELVQVYYGHENLINKVPAATVSTEGLLRNLYETGEMTRNEITVEILIYYSERGPSEMSTRECELLSTSLVPVLEADRTLGGLLIHGYVNKITPVGSARNRSRIMKTGQLTYVGVSRTRLGV